MPDADVHNHLKIYAGLTDSVSSLASLATVNPHLAEHVVELAMCLGVYAAERKLREAARAGQLEDIMTRYINRIDW